VHLEEIVDALLGHLRGEITLHASCVARGGVAVGCLGESGAGKSTLAMRLCALHAAELLSDDVTAIQIVDGRVEALPTESHHWLRHDVAREMKLDVPASLHKVPLEPRLRARGPVRVRALVSLAFRDVEAPQLVPLAGADAFTALSLSAFRLGLDVFAPMRADLDNLSYIARDTEIFELRRRREATAMDASVQVVSDLLDRLTSTGGGP